MDGSQEAAVFQSLGRIEEALAELRGPNGRIATLEADAKETAKLLEKHERVVVLGGYLAVPVLGIFHALLKKVGL